MSEITVTLFIPPDGTQSEAVIRDIDAEDADFFNENSVKISMEQIMTGEAVIYADYGMLDEDGDPVEEMVMVDMNTTTVREALKGLRMLVENML